MSCKFFILCGESSVIIFGIGVYGIGNNKLLVCNFFLL